MPLKKIFSWKLLIFTLYMFYARKYFVKFPKSNCVRNLLYDKRKLVGFVGNCE